MKNTFRIRPHQSLLQQFQTIFIGLALFMVLLMGLAIHQSLENARQLMGKQIYHHQILVNGWVKEQLERMELQTLSLQSYAEKVREQHVMDKYEGLRVLVAEMQALNGLSRALFINDENRIIMPHQNSQDAQQPLIRFVNQLTPMTPRLMITQPNHSFNTTLGFSHTEPSLVIINRVPFFYDTGDSLGSMIIYQTLGQYDHNLFKLKALLNVPYVALSHATPSEVTTDIHHWSVLFQADLQYQIALNHDQTTLGYVSIVQRHNPITAQFMHQLLSYSAPLLVMSLALIFLYFV